MITPYQSPEGKDEKASNFWSNLAGKLGLSAPIVRQASAAEQKEQRLSDAIQTHGATPRAAGSVRPDALVTKVSAAQDKALLDRYAGVFQRAVGELGQSERVKAADRLSRIEADMASLKDQVAQPTAAPDESGPLGGGLEADLAGEIASKADAVSGACAQLREKVQALTIPQVMAIENAFLVLNDAKHYVEKMKKNSPVPGADLTMDMEMGLPGAEDVTGDVPDMPPAPGAETLPMAPIAGQSGTVKKAEGAYEDMRHVHMKLCLVESLLGAIVSEHNVSDMMGGQEPVPGLPPEGMPPTDQMEGEQHKDEPMAPMMEEAKLCGRMSKFSASGDPGDSEPGNTIYKDLNKCRDCVWFESDWTHETYRDKCKHCIHAALGGAVEHWMPRAQQMIMWMPAWGSEPERVRLSFKDTLGLKQEASQVSPTALHIASEIVASAAHTAVELGSELVAYFTDPVVGRQMPKIAHEVAAEIEKRTGIEIGVSFAKAKAWGRKAMGLAEGEVAIACDHEMVHLAKGEKRQIKELREKLRGEKDPSKIKSLNEAINSLYDRIESDKKRKEERRKGREEKQKSQQEALDKEPAKLPAATTASLIGTLRLADSKMDHEDGGKHDPEAQQASNQTPLPQGKGQKKLFKVVTVSSNANSFGLQGVILMARDGEAYEAAHGQQGIPAKGETVAMPLDENGQIAWGAAGYEIPRKLPAPPNQVISEVWGTREAASSGRSL